MDTQRFAAVLFFAAFLAVILSVVVIPSGLYRTEDIEERLQIIEADRFGWLTERAMTVVYGLAMVGGFSLLAARLRTAGNPWFPTLGAAAIITGTIVGFYFVYLQTTDPRGGYSGVYTSLETLAYWLWLAGTLLFGVAILQAGLSNWLGYLTAGVALLYGLAFFITGAGFLTPFLLGFLSLFIGIVLLRH